MTTKIHDIMRRGVIFCSPDDSAKKVAEMMVSNKIRSIAVVDEKGEVYGSISRLDLLKQHGMDLEKVKAQEVMRPYRFHVDAQWTVEQAIAKMKELKIEHLLITEQYTSNNRLIGIVTNYDIAIHISGLQLGHYETMFKLA